MHENFETELRLRLGRDKLRAALDMLGRMAQQRPKTERLDAVYYDTRTYSLFKAGLSFRVRRENNRFVQTLKKETPDALVRAEWSKPVATETPDLADGAIARRVRRAVGSQPLHPMIRVAVTRRTFLLRRIHGGAIQATIDVGDIVAGRRKSSICEIELELKAGASITIYRTALAIAAKLPVSIEPLSKSTRGYRLLGRTAVALRLAPPKLESSDTLGTALQRAARRYFAQFLGNIAAMHDGDANAVHMMRVAVRRLRSAIAAAKSLLPREKARATNAKLRVIQRSLGDLRDFDVLAQDMVARRTSETSGDRGRKELLSWINTRRHVAAAAAHKAVESPRQTRAWLEIMEWFEVLDPRKKSSSPLSMQLHRAVPTLLGRLKKRVRKRSRRIDQQSIADLHRLRIACKKLRYGIEMFASLYPAHAVDRMLGPLKELQNDLGRLNDAHVAGSRLKSPRTPRIAAKYAQSSVKRFERRIAPAIAHALTSASKLREIQDYW